MHAALQCRMVSSLCLVFFIVETGALRILEDPVSQTVLLGEYPEFDCRSEGHSPHWVINGVAYSRNVHRQIGIDMTDHEQTGPNDYWSRLQVHATENNNNTQLLCRIANTGIESLTALLTIQGLLDYPPNLTVTVINATVALITWSAPHSLNISGNPDILGYNLMIQDASSHVQHTILSINSTTTVYYFINNHCPLNAYAVLVAGRNQLGLGNFSEPVMFTHGFLNRNISISGSNSNQLACEALCEDSLLVTWLINGKFLSQLGSQLSVRVESDYSLQCASRDTGSTHTTTLEVVSDIPTPYTIQCAAVSTCGQTDETTRCRSESLTCYSNPVLVEEVISLSTTMDSTILLHTVTGKELAPHSDSTDSTLITVGSAAGILVILCCILLIALGVTCHRKVTKDPMASTIELSAKNNEVIYEQCGDPVYSVAAAPPSPPPITKPCEAYAASSQPTTEPNTAYATTPQPHTDPNIAYATSHSIAQNKLSSDSPN